MMVCVFGEAEEFMTEQRANAIVARDLVRYGGHSTAKAAAEELAFRLGLTSAEADTMVREAWAETLGACLYCGALAQEPGSTVDAIEEVDRDEAGHVLSHGTVLACERCRSPHQQMMLSEVPAADDDDQECPF